MTSTARAKKTTRVRCVALGSSHGPLSSRCLSLGNARKDKGNDILWLWAKRSLSTYFADYPWQRASATEGGLAIGRVCLVPCRYPCKWFWCTTRPVMDRTYRDVACYDLAIMGNARWRNAKTRNCCSWWTNKTIDSKAIHGKSNLLVSRTSRTMDLADLTYTEEKRPCLVLEYSCQWKSIHILALGNCSSGQDRLRRWPKRLRLPDLLIISRGRTTSRRRRHCALHYWWRNRRKLNTDLQDKLATNARHQDEISLQLLAGS